MEWYIGAIALVVALAVVIWIRTRLPIPQALGGTSSKRPGGGPRGFSVWSYQGASWTMKEDKSEPGHKPGAPPTQVGQFEGHCVKVASVPHAKG
jgi:hypothetical protein